MNKRFKEIFDGGSDQWLWAAYSGLAYIFVEIIDLPGYCGSDATSQWVGSVAVVDLGSADPETMLSALRSCGQESESELLSAMIAAGSGCDQYIKEHRAGLLRLAECMFSYGVKSPIWDDSSGVPEHECPRCNGEGEIEDPEPPLFGRFEYEHPSLKGEYGFKYATGDEHWPWSHIAATLAECFADYQDHCMIDCPRCDGYGQVTEDSDEEGEAFQSLKREAFKQASTMLYNPATRDHVLDTRIVNRLGQTAREHAGGTLSLWETLRKIQADPNATDEQRLILKMYGKAGQTLGAGPVPGDIPEVA